MQQRAGNGHFFCDVDLLTCVYRLLQNYTANHTHPRPANHTTLHLPLDSSPPTRMSSTYSGPPTAPNRHEPPGSTSTASFITYPITRTVSGLLRRLSADHQPSGSRKSSGTRNGIAGMEYTPPRKASPFQPPPLTPLSLQGYQVGTPEDARLLSRTLAEEIRLLVPPRLQLVDNWELTYSLEQDGASLSTLYKKVDEYRGKRGGFVLVVRDLSGNVRSFSIYWNLLVALGIYNRRLSRR